jgi:hypothetical protein
MPALALPLVGGGWLVDVAVPPARVLRRLVSHLRQPGPEPWQRVVMLQEDGFVDPEQFRPVDAEDVLVTVVRRPVTPG